MNQLLMYGSLVSENTISNPLLVPGIQILFLVQNMGIGIPEGNIETDTCFCSLQRSNMRDILFFTKPSCATV
jgi:hypothetical protein